jgi:hypothetical protein
MEKFISVFGQEEIGKGDVFELVYLPGQGVLV